MGNGMNKERFYILAVGIMKKWIALVENHLMSPSEPMSLIAPEETVKRLGVVAYNRIGNVNPICNTDLEKILSGLYVGNYRDSKDSAQLNRHGITHIIAIHDAARKLHHDKHYLCVMASDTPDQNLSQYFPVCNDFIHAARLRGGNVLIHCLAGMSRSVTVAVAYIMSVTDLTWKDALKVVRVGRSVANPNLGFQKQLQDFEVARLLEERRRLKERYPSLALVDLDMHEVRSSLASYDALLEARDICEGSCGRGEACPTGMCRPPGPKKSLRRKSSTSSLRTPPSLPRQLPATPGTLGTLQSAESTMSMSSLGRRPRSGPSGLHSYTGNGPPFRSASRTDVTELPPGVISPRHMQGRISSAPGTPLGTPPGSPRWLRKTHSSATLQEKLLL